MGYRGKVVSDYRKKNIKH